MHFPSLISGDRLWKIRRQEAGARPTTSVAHKESLILESAVIPLNRDIANRRLDFSKASIDSEIRSQVDRYTALHNRLSELAPRPKVDIPDVLKDQVIKGFQKALNQAGIKIELLWLPDHDPRMANRLAITLHSTIYLSRSISLPELLAYVVHESEHLFDHDEALSVASEIDVIRHAKGIAQTLRDQSHTQALGPHAIRLADTVDYWALKMEFRLATASLQGTKAGSQFLQAYKLPRIKDAPPHYCETTAAAYRTEGPLTAEADEAFGQRLHRALGKTHSTNSEDTLNRLVLNQLFQFDRRMLTDLTARVNAELEDWLEYVVRLDIQSEKTEALFAASGAKTLLEFQAWVRTARPKLSLSERQQFDEDLLEFLQQVLHTAIHYKKSQYRLPGILSKSQANCVGGTLLFKALGEKFGLPIGIVEVLVVKPGQSDYHFCNLVEGPQGKRLIDWTSNDSEDPVFDRIAARVDGKYRILNLQEYRTLPIEGLSTREIEATILGWNGTIYREMGAKEAALKANQQTVTLSPMASNFHTNLGVAYLDSGMENKALEHFNRAIELDPLSPAPYVNRSGLHFDTGHRERAYEDIAKALALDPILGSAYANRAFFESEEKNWEQAFLDIEKAVEYDPHNPDLWVAKGAIHLSHWKATKDRADLIYAVQDFTKAIELDSNLKKAYRWRAQAYDALKEKKNAKADRQSANREGETTEETKDVDPTSLFVLLNDPALHTQERWLDFVFSGHTDQLKNFLKHPSQAGLRALIVMSRSHVRKIDRIRITHEFRQMASLSKDIVDATPAELLNVSQSWTDVARKAMIDALLLGFHAVLAKRVANLTAVLTLAGDIRPDFQFSPQDGDPAQADLRMYARVTEAINEQIFMPAGEWFKPIVHDNSITAAYGVIGEFGWRVYEFLAMKMPVVDIRTQDEYFEYHRTSRHAFISWAGALQRAAGEFDSIHAQPTGTVMDNWPLLRSLLNAESIDRAAYLEIAGFANAEAESFRAYKDAVFAARKAGLPDVPEDEAFILGQNLKPTAPIRELKTNVIDLHDSAPEILSFMTRLGAVIDRMREYFHEDEPDLAWLLMQRFMTKEITAEGIGWTLLSYLIRKVGGFDTMQSMYADFTKGPESFEQRSLFFLEKLYAANFWPDAERPAQIEPTIRTNEPLCLRQAS